MPRPPRQPKPDSGQLYRDRACRSKRRFRTQGDALDAAAALNLERERKAYQCPCCGHWHLTTRFPED
ncbi:MAG: hypothetical protein LBR12_03845 [Opitutaceae bacterium]|jgi:hypothetical protein|nr:hypothetical protein [Opitutaceae bacterium]